MPTMYSASSTCAHLCRSSVIVTRARRVILIYRWSAAPAEVGIRAGAVFQPLTEHAFHQVLRQSLVVLEVVVTHHFAPGGRYQYSLIRSR